MVSTEAFVMCGRWNDYRRTDIKIMRDTSVLYAIYGASFEDEEKAEE